MAKHRPTEYRFTYTGDQVKAMEARQLGKLFLRQIMEKSRFADNQIRTIRNTINGITYTVTKRFNQYSLHIDAPIGGEEVVILDQGFLYAALGGAQDPEILAKTAGAWTHLTTADDYAGRFSNPADHTYSAIGGYTVHDALTLGLGLKAQGYKLASTPSTNWGSSLKATIRNNQFLTVLGKDSSGDWAVISREFTPGVNVGGDWYDPVTAPGGWKLLGTVPLSTWPKSPLASDISVNRSGTKIFIDLPSADDAAPYTFAQFEISPNGLNIVFPDAPVYYDPAYDGDTLYTAVTYDIDDPEYPDGRDVFLTLYTEPQQAYSYLASFYRGNSLISINSETTIEYTSTQIDVAKTTGDGTWYYNRYIDSEMWRYKDIKFTGKTPWSIREQYYYVIGDQDTEYNDTIYLAAGDWDTGWNNATTISTQLQLYAIKYSIYKTWGVITVTRPISSSYTFTSTPYTTTTNMVFEVYDAADGTLLFSKTYNSIDIEFTVFGWSLDMSTDTSPFPDWANWQDVPNGLYSALGGAGATTYTGGGTIEYDQLGSVTVAFTAFNPILSSFGELPDGSVSGMVTNLTDDIEIFIRNPAGNVRTYLSSALLAEIDSGNEYVNPL